MNVEDFNEWRANYNKWSYAEHQEFYSRVYAEYPGQKRFDADSVCKFLELATEREVPQRVIEMGGWNGELCSEIRIDPYQTITAWINFEICKEAREDYHYSPNYICAQQDAFIWDNILTLPPANVFISSHSIEHITTEDLILLVQKIDDHGIKWCYVQSPLHETERPNWHDYLGTHILQASWREVDAIFALAGFSMHSPTSQIRWYYR